MKLLLLTDCPPCKNLTGGLFLDQLCRFLEPGSVVCFAVVAPELDAKLTPDLDWIPIEYAAKPSEAGDYDTAGAAIPAHEIEVRARFIEDQKRVHIVPPLIDRAMEFGVRHGVDAVWAVLEGQTMVRMALPVAQGLGVPLFSLVWDPLSWWLDANRVDAFNAQLALEQFDATLRLSRSCAAASWNMAEDYQHKYGIPCTAIVASHDVTLGRRPTPQIGDRKEFVLGMAGQFYASEEWHQLIASLNAQDWHIAGRDIRLMVLGHYLPPSDIPEGRIEFLGWKAQEEAIQILSDRTDALYCPYPFNDNMKEVASFSFPSKIPLYFAAGLPVIFHGPSYSSPAHYFERHGAGLLCLTHDSYCVINSIEQLISDPELAHRMALKSQEAFRRDFTLESMKAALWAFLEGNDHKRFETPSDSAAEGANDGKEQDRAGEAAGRHSGLLGLEYFQRSSATLRRDRDRLATLLAAAHDEKRIALSIRDSLSQHVLALENLQNQMRSENERLTSELTRLKEDAIGAARDRDALRLEVLTLQQQHDQAIERLRQELTQEVDFIGRLRNLELAEKEGLQGQVQYYVDELAAAAKAHGELESRYSQLLDTKVGLEQQVAYYKGELATLQDNEQRS